jgi:Mg2+-importing ATPase
LLLSSLAVVGVGLIMPYTPLGVWFKFVRPPLIFFTFLVVFIGAYLLLVEVLKRVFYKRYGQRLEHYA